MYMYTRELFSHAYVYMRVFICMRVVYGVYVVWRGVFAAWSRCGTLLSTAGGWSLAGVAMELHSFWPRAAVKFSSWEGMCGRGGSSGRLWDSLGELWKSDANG